MSRSLFQRILHKHAAPVDLEQEQPTQNSSIPSAVPDEDASVTKEDNAELESAESNNSEPAKETQDEPEHSITNESAADNNEVASERDEEERQQGHAMSALLASDSAPEIKKRALRSLFFSGQFSEVDELNDYHQDFSQIKPLSSDAASQLRQWAGDKVDELTDESNEGLTEEEVGSSAIETEGDGLLEDNQEAMIEVEEQEVESLSETALKQDLADKAFVNHPLDKPNKP
ncbi:DUF3306 domain-containing protein [Vibrio ezurae]|uniref:DUF3306 domain-containing protein n=1 Tax=Vibrio ezurae NBRC 102218 TaxID=1219080 RepID=U3CCQ2_9VIBR|nr:DUF3306 domain-containing protein [Vibrio ezurae]GAD79079.1 hypothetical protein VEZ01S_08_01150 [Vibrio ezurae NBRC 102218]